MVYIYIYIYIYIIFFLLTKKKIKENTWETFQENKRNEGRVKGATKNTLN